MITIVKDDIYKDNKLVGEIDHDGVAFVESRFNVDPEEVKKALRESTDIQTWEIIH